MHYSFFITATLALGWMLSPESLVLQGNEAGIGAMFYFPALAAGALISGACIFLLHHPALNELPDKPIAPAVRVLGIFPAMTLLVASRLTLVLFLPTGMLVTAGFTFNETFLHWFPNFGFSFLLLAFILILHLIDEKVAAAMQLIFIGTTLSCLIILAVSGISGQGEIPTVTTESPFPLFTSLSAGTLLLFLGYDPADGSSGTKRSTLYHCWVIIAGYLLFTLWGIASVVNVNPAKLAHSTIPYILTAREILGQPGRIIIGIAIISGTLACVNMLFILSNRTMTALTEKFSLRFFRSIKLKKRIYPLFFSIVIGIFMMTGMAGSDNLEIYIRGSLLLWLLTIGIHCFTATRLLQILGKRTTWFGYTVSAILIFSVIYLIFSHPQNMHIFGFCVLVLTAGAVISKGLLQMAWKKST